jgi:hypothetical protein
MNDQTKNNGPVEGAGYVTPGEDKIIKSASEAVPSPSRTSQERLQTPPARIESLGATPGNANPALDETAGFEQGEASTADLLRARETAEEQLPRTSGNVHPYQDQGAGASADEYRQSDTGRPNWPDDRQEAPLDYMDAPRANEPLLAGAPDTFGLNIKGRQDWVMDRAGTQASEAESGSGLPPVGLDAEEDIYERREMHTPSETSDIDRIAPGMVNNPVENEDGKR